MNGGWMLVAAAATAVTVILAWRRPALSRLADPTGLSWRPPTWARARPDALALRTRVLMGLGTALAVVAWADGFPTWLVALFASALGATTVTVLGVVEPASSARRRAQLLAELPQALRLTAACLSAGLPLRRAIESVASSMGGVVAAEFEPVLAQIWVGGAEPEAWLSRRDHPVLGPLCRDIARAVDSGTALHGVLIHRAQEIQADHRSAAEARAKAVGVRTVLPLSLCFLPAFLLLGVVPTVAGMVSPMLQP